MGWDVERWGRLGTAAVADALDRHGLVGCVADVGAIGGGECCGPAFTVRYTPVRRTEEADVGDFLDDVPPGAVVVIDNGGRLDCTVWGGIMSRFAHRRAVAGTVIDGACRDIAEARAIGYPLFARAPFMRTGKERVRLQEIGGEVELGGVAVAPGDLIRADADGVVVVPAAARDVIADAEEIAAAETRILEALEAGLSLRQARAEHGYHRLQRGNTHG